MPLNGAKYGYFFDFIAHANEGFKDEDVRMHGILCTAVIVQYSGSIVKPFSCNFLTV